MCWLTPIRCIVASKPSWIAAATCLLFGCSEVQGPRVSRYIVDDVCFAAHQYLVSAPSDRCPSVRDLVIEGYLDDPGPALERSIYVRCEESWVVVSGGRWKSALRLDRL